MDKIVLKGEKRDVLGRKVKRLRKDGKLPANIYGPDIKSTSVAVGIKEFESVYQKAGETSIVEIEVGKSTYPVLVHNVQIDPVSSVPLHVDFFKVDLKKKVTTNIPLVVVGESPAEKQGLGTLVTYIDELEVEALPGDLVDKIEVNVEKLVEADQSLAIKDLLFDKSKLEVKNDPETIVVKIEVQKEEPVEEIKPAEEEVTPEGEAATEGGETPQEEKSEESAKEGEGE